MRFISTSGKMGRAHFGHSYQASLGNGARIAARLVSVSVLVFCLFSVASAQVPFPTSLGDNARTAANTNETLLSPSNVNKANFGHLFNYPTDYVAQAQPLYVPNVDIPGKGVHNVVYVVTMKDTVYAFDAESNTGDNAAPLWSVNFTDPANGITTASGTNLPCGNEGGFLEEGIVSTPAIDVASSTMYLVAKTLDNGTVVHRLHALDLATGQEKLGGPAVLSATSTSNAGHVTVFNSLHQKNRPGLLLMNGVVYLAFGSNGCNDNNTGWVLAYDATTLQQTGVFNTNPDHGLTSIWQSGGGVAGDDAGNLYPLTSEGNFDVDLGGQGYTEAVLRLSGSSLDLTDFFIPWDVAFINSHDLDLSGGSPVVLPDQDGPFPHVMVAAGKQGTIYVLNRDNLGMYAPSDLQIIQELPGVIGQVRGGPAYWNDKVYFSGKGDQLKVFSVSGGMLSPAPIVQTSAKLTGAHTPAISANGNADGVVWVINGGGLFAYDANTLAMLYNSKQLPGDALPAVGHFATQTVANGRIYIATRNSLEVYGLKHYMLVASGGGQSATVGTPLPAPIQVQAVQAYSNIPFPGITVSFSDGGKGGTFNPPSAVTDASGNATTTYTVPTKSGTYTLTAAATGFGNLTITATALPGPPVLMISGGGNNQSGLAGSVLPVPLAAKVQDAYKNGIPGLTVTFDDAGQGGVLTPTSAVTDASGKARVTYQLPSVPGTYKVSASTAGVKTFKFTETAQ
jgi:Bacterial Ig-like domain (group 1)